MRIRHFAMLMTLSLAILWAIQGTSIAQSTTVEVVTFALTDSDLISSSYSVPFGSGNGVYIAAPNGTPPANNIPYYLWPGGAAENLSDNANGVANGTAPLGEGAWQSTSLPSNDGKVEVLIHPDEIFGNGTYTLSDVNSITWETNKPDPQTDPDWYVNIWLDAGGGNVAFLSGEPYWSNNLNASANNWNTWTADDTAGGTNEITFHEPGFACTTFGWASGGSFGTMPTLDQLISGAWTWNNVPSQNFLPGCAGTPNPLTTTINYSTMPILAISIATGNPWAGPLTGFVDNLEIQLDDPTTSGNENHVIVDFEPTAPTNPPLIAKQFQTNPIAIGGTSVLQFTLVNPNSSPIGGVSFVDNLPAGLEIAPAPNILNSCGGILTAPAGGTSITLTGGSIEGSTSCAVSVSITGTTSGTFTNITNPVTTTTGDFPNATGNDTATDSLTVEDPPEEPVNNNEQVAPQINVFDPAISKIGFLVPGDVGVTGEQLEWVVTVSNTGTVAGQNVVITDTLLPALQIDSVDAPEAIVNLNGQTVSVTYPILNVGQTMQFSIFTTVLDGSTVTNTACVTADNQSSEECASVGAVSQLPSTGETPYWHYWLVALTGFGFVVFMGMMAQLERRYN